MKNASVAAAISIAVLAAAASAGGATDSTIKQKDSKAQSNARNMVSEVEACFTDTEDYSKCNSASELNSDGSMMEFDVPYGTGPGRARVSRATKTSYTVDSHSRSGNHFYVVHLSDGLTVRKCTTRGRGLCRHSGRW